ncbi:potassium-transporting ATPase subunit C [Streptomyces sp. NPDC091209]|uniref:potassium-transporting ATPase subunit C n=1 Tax=Streptomyces sp. NPDC091209 TaxID=3365974 RepID=UPI00382A4FF3
MSEPADRLRRRHVHPGTARSDPAVGKPSVRQARQAPGAGRPGEGPHTDARDAEGLSVWPRSDAVTASGSGLDPDISPAYAKLQAPRVARERGASTADVRKLISKYSTGRALGVLGEPGVNVVELNLALDRGYPTTATSAPSPKQGA